ncbi:MAG: homoserine dehydrogenase [Chloroflexi bacterium]|nr:homoserine dehydrogenase [Chloroflexota bacterium]MBP7045712.1 homoserine dehydrogenase [Chloroflexota bacterium]
MKHIPVLLLGAGGVGSAVLRQIVDGRSPMLARNHVHFDVVAVCDSQSWQLQPGGLSDDQLRDIVARKAQGQAVGEKRPSTLQILNLLAEAGLEQVIVVDVTAVSGLEPTLNRALELGYGVVLANKKVFAGPWATAQRYFHHPRIRHESTVGGGQPVIATLRYLLDTNDPIHEIKGQLSGTLGFICQQLDQGVAFSTAVAEAKTRGYTEPDPREDLGGLDVMRKVMILGRMAGWPLETGDITVESLYTPDLANLSVPDFMAQVAVLDEVMAQRVAAAQANRQVLRYLAQVREGKGVVGLTAVPAGSALANLKFISFRTGRYDDEPLMICGKGAGVEMTAAGVIGDMLALVREEF